MQPTKLQKSPWPKPRYQKWKYFQQSLQMKSDDKSENLQPADMEVDLPQPRKHRDLRLAERVPCVYPTFDSLQPQQIFDYIGSFGTEVEFKVRSHQYSSSSAGHTLSTKRVIADPPPVKNKKSATDLLQQPTTHAGHNLPTPTSALNQTSLKHESGSFVPVVPRNRLQRPISSYQAAESPQTFKGKAKNSTHKGATETAADLGDSREWFYRDTYKSPDIISPPLSGANVIPVNKTALNPVLKRIQQQKQEQNQDRQKQQEQQQWKEQERKEQLKRQQKLENEHQCRHRLKEHQEKQLQQEKEKEKEQQQKQQSVSELAIPIPMNPFQEALDQRADNNSTIEGEMPAAAVSPPLSTPAFFLPHPTRLAPPMVEPAAQKPVAETLEPKTLPVEPDTTSSAHSLKPLAINNTATQQKNDKQNQPVHGPGGLPTPSVQSKQPPVAVSSTSSSKGKDILPSQEPTDPVSAAIAAAVEAVATEAEVEIEGGQAGDLFSASTETASQAAASLNISDSIEFASNITMLLLVSGLAFGQNDGFADRFASVAGASLDQAIKLAQSIINGSPVPEQNPKQ
ncbi:hypothetical protein EV178_002885 [Coemansia sp. RSA 1646]|nr:hypothetical protein EV178_002885 [Coemansia sp. RSA 1646]KAJ1771675.1 hypothetical protein LPJ74_002102 [Coemansia sp. RSA 1843]KAJ2214116.1 hypothetical protein EV179_003255 [Coemansia sp. RSA 487]